MKFLNILSIIFAIAFLQACNQLEDEINALGDNIVTADIEITLTDDDYDFVDQGFGNFDSEDQAKELIPLILTNNYPQFGGGSSALVHYDLYDPIRINDELEFTLTDEDYVALGEDFGTLSSNGDIFDAVELKHPAPAANDVVTLTYEWFCFGCPDEGTRTSKLTYYEGSWHIAYVPTSEDYAFMGQSFSNFSSRTTARERIAKILDLRYLFDDAGDIRTSVFVYTFVDDNDDRQFVDFMAVFQFDGTNWQPFQDAVQRSLQLGHDGNGWVPDNTIKYTLTTADYDAIVVATADSNPSGSSNLAIFGNFNLASWTDEQLISAIGNRLLEIKPKVEGQKYLVFYDFYDGSSGVGTFRLIYTGGAYVEVE